MPKLTITETVRAELATVKGLEIKQDVAGAKGAFIVYCAKSDRHFLINRYGGRTPHFMAWVVSVRPGGTWVNMGIFIAMEREAAQLGRVVADLDLVQVASSARQWHEVEHDVAERLLAMA